MSQVAADVVAPDQVSRKAAADRAVELYAASGQLVGLGTGTTAHWVIQAFGDKVAAQTLQNMTFVCTSKATEEKARARGLRVVEVDDAPQPIDLAIDGADEIWTDAAGHHHLLKGRGAALYREKFIESMARRFVCVADAKKIVHALGADYLPVEIEGQWNPKTLCGRVERACRSHGIVLAAAIRGGAQPLVTDNGNYIVDVTFGAGGIYNPVALHRDLKLLNGVVETGLFVDFKPTVVLGDAAGRAWEL